MKIHLLKHIETPRLIIRPIQLGDEIQLNHAVNNSLVSLQKWMPWANDPGIEATRDFVQRGVFAWGSASVLDFPMAILHKEDKRIIAASGYNDRSAINQDLYEIGYWCDIGYQGQGYVTEYVNALAAYALSQLEAKTVVIRMEVGNEKSIAVAKRLHFANQGTKPSATKKDATDYYFTNEKLDNLPPLEMSWHYQENNSTDAQMIDWAKDALKTMDEKAFADSKVIVKTPWSTVIAINTEEAIVYLKHMPEKTPLETDIIKRLKKSFDAPVPEVIAENKALHCFLMKDAGTSLRTVLTQEFNTSLLCTAIDQFTSLQIAIAYDVAPLLELGVPDWSLDKITELFKNMLEQQDLLTSDGLSEQEIAHLKSLLPTIEILCQKLSSYAVNDTLVQCDFHDNKILFDEVSHKITFIDLGEIVISHPFFSLVGCLRQMHKHYSLTENSVAFLAIQNACLKHFMTIETEENILNAFKIAKLLRFVHEALAQHRLIQACDRDEIMTFQHGKLSLVLKDLMVAYEKTQ